MKTTLNWNFTWVAVTVLIAAGVGMFAPAGVERLSPVAAAVGLQSAWADSRYGILGLPAPELGLDTWIDGSGRPMGSVRLGDYRGKVVLLYFFQDW